MKPIRKETALSRRIRELQSQSAAVQNDIKSLNKSLKKIGSPGGVTAIATQPPKAREPLRSRLNPNYAATVGTETTTSVAVTNQEPSPDLGQPEAEVNLFNFDHTQSPVAGTAFPKTVSETATPPHRYRRAAAASEQPKLASYLASGSFGKGGPLGRERSIQRIKAIFGLIAAVTFAYILYRAVFR